MKKLIAHTFRFDFCFLFPPRRRCRRPITNRVNIFIVAFPIWSRTIYFGSLLPRVRLFKMARKALRERDSVAVESPPYRIE